MCTACCWWVWCRPLWRLQRCAVPCCCCARRVPCPFCLQGAEGLQIRATPLGDGDDSLQGQQGPAPLAMAPAGTEGGRPGRGQAPAHPNAHACTCTLCTGIHALYARRRHGPPVPWPACRPAGLSYALVHPNACNPCARAPASTHRAATFKIPSQLRQLYVVVECRQRLLALAGLLRHKLRAPGVKQQQQVGVGSA